MKKETTRDKVRKRDNYTCQDCGLVRTPDQAKKERKKQLDVHHTDSLCGLYHNPNEPEERMDKMITLCHKCHFNRYDRNKIRTPRSEMNKEERKKMIELEKKVTRMHLAGEIRGGSLSKREEQIWGFILGYMTDYKKFPTNADVIKKFNISKQSASISLKKMEEKNYIKRNGKAIEIIIFTPNI